MQAFLLFSAFFLALLLYHFCLFLSIFRKLWVVEERLIKYEIIRNIRGGVEAVTCEDDMICMHQYSRKFFYNFNGEYEKSEENDGYNMPSFEREKKIGNYVYKYSVNPIGLETVKMYTDENVVTLFSGVSFLIAKLFEGCLIGIFLILFVFVIIFPEFNKITIDK